jgi:hypothetical protein
VDAEVRDVVCSRCGGAGNVLRPDWSPSYPRPGEPDYVVCQQCGGKKTIPVMVPKGDTQVNDFDSIQAGDEVEIWSPAPHGPVRTVATAGRKIVGRADNVTGWSTETFGVTITRENFIRKMVK